MAALGLGLGLKFEGGAGFNSENPTSFHAPLTSSLTLSRGTGTYDFSRDTAAPEATVTDFEGLVKNCKAEEARFQGVRRVENLCTRTDILDDSPLFGTHETGILAPDGTYTANRLTAVSNILICIQDNLLTSAGRKVVNSIWLRSDDVTEIDILTGASGSTTQPVTITNEWQRYSPPAATISTSAACGIYDTSITTGLTVEYWHPQCEEVTGQTVDDAPSEYVSVGVGTGDELNPDVGFDSSSGWAVVLGDNTQGRLDTDPGGDDYLVMSNKGPMDAPTAGKIYIVSVERGGSNTASPDTASFATATLPNILASTGPGTYTDIVVGLGTAKFSISLDGATGLGWFDNLSIKEVDHGCNVDAVKYFDYHNTLEVVDNVVVGTGARGAEYYTDPTFDVDAADGETTVDGWELSGAFVSGGAIESTGFTIFNGAAFTGPSGFYEVILQHGEVYPSGLTFTIGGAAINILSGLEGKHTRAIKYLTNGGSSSMIFGAAGQQYRGISVKPIDVPNSYAQGSTFGRRVHNIALESDAGEWGIITGSSGSLVAAPDGTTTARTISAAAGSIWAYETVSNTAGTVVLNSMWLRCSTGTESIGIIRGLNNTTTTTCNLTTTWKRFVAEEGISSNSTYIGLSGSGITAGIEVWHPQQEIVTGISSPLPGEYISNGLEVYPYSGTGIDGIAEFPTTNPNEVTSNVVTPTATTYAVTPGDGVLIEGTRDNINSYSDVSGDWTAYGTGASITFNDAVSPFGSQTAPTITFGTSGDSGVSRATAVATPGNICLSFYVNKGTTDHVGMYHEMIGGYYTVDLATDGTVTTTATVGAEIAKGKIDAGDFWRVWGSFTLAEAVAATTYLYSTSTSTHDEVMCCVQTEAGTFPSSYIPVPTGSAVTRDDDLLTYDITNLPTNDASVVSTFSQAYAAPSAYSGIVAGYGVAGSVPLGINNTNNRPYAFDGTTWRNSALTYTLGAASKAAVTYEGSEIVMALDGASTNGITYDGSMEHDSETRFGVGSYAIGGSELFGTVKDIKIYNKVLPETKLQELTKVESD